MKKYLPLKKEEPLPEVEPTMPELGLNDGDETRFGLNEGDEAMPELEDILPPPGLNDGDETRFGSDEAMSETEMLPPPPVFPETPVESPVEEKKHTKSHHYHHKKMDKHHHLGMGGMGGHCK